MTVIRAVATNAACALANAIFAKAVAIAMKTVPILLKIAAVIDNLNTILPLVCKSKGFAFLSNIFLLI